MSDFSPIYGLSASPPVGPATGSVIPVAIDSSGRLILAPNTSGINVFATIEASSFGGSIPFHLVSAASINATVVKNSSGTLYSYEIVNTAAALRYVKLYDLATAPVPASNSPFRTVGIPATSSVRLGFDVGIRFLTGLAFVTVVNIADTDATAVGAGDLSVDLSYF